jgi:catalase
MSRRSGSANSASWPNVDADLCAQVAAGLGLPAPKGQPATDVTPSAALTQVALKPGPITGRKVGIVADAKADLAGFGKIRRALAKHGAGVYLIAPAAGKLSDGTRTEVVDRTLLTASIEFDALLLADGLQSATDIKLVLLLQEAYRHCKAAGAGGSGADILSASMIPADAPAC